jgi:hypothetical protein
MGHNLSDAPVGYLATSLAPIGQKGRASYPCSDSPTTSMNTMVFVWQMVVGLFSRERGCNAVHCCKHPLLQLSLWEIACISHVLSMEKAILLAVCLACDYRLWL